MFLTYQEASRTMNAKENFDINQVIGYDALYDSMLKCKNNTLRKTSVSSFYLNAPEKIYNLNQDLENRTYQAKPPIKFQILSPKPRDISSIIFRDRVYQRSLNDNAVYSMMTKSFIYDNYACQKGKGTDKARERFEEYLHKFYRKHGTDGYILQLDIKGYYPNMRHDICEKIFQDKLPKDIFDKVQTILHEQYAGDKGYDAGSQLVQIAGISVLDKMDHYIKEKLHIKYYLRYMDDFLLVHKDKDYLADCLNKIKVFLEDYNYTLNPNKSDIYSVTKGVTFLGFTFKLSKTGKVLKLMTSRNVKLQRKKLRSLVNRCKNKLMTREQVDDSYNTWRSHVSKGNTHKVICRMDKYYNSLWKE